MAAPGITLAEAIAARNSVGRLLCAKTSGLHRMESLESNPGTSVCRTCGHVEQGEPLDLPDYRYFVSDAPTQRLDGVAYRVGQDLQNVEMRVGAGTNEWVPSAFPSFGRLRNAFELSGYPVREVRENEIDK